MKFNPPLQRGVLLRRYKRFLTDIETADGERLTIHCPNTGSMRHCAEPGDIVWYSTSASKTRKYPNTWELNESPRGWIGVNTGNANKLVREAIEAGVIAELAGYESVRAEVRYGSENSRIDLLLTADNRPDCYVEVKSVTLLEPDKGAGAGYFPDAVSTRGTKHLRELAEVAQNGQRAILFFCVQHSGIDIVSPAAHIDPDYALTLAEALAAGVEVMAWGVSCSPSRVQLDRPVKFRPALP
ncbi:MAG: DNA/RNA nuclease SfsA [Pseudomonadales bacterium]|nr:DNA/RNA nuclease SfsA [Pseudomonadales bacterium]